ncbi:MoaD/ThiS family protein [Flavobacterium cellulosilyticum]|uniref:MoaD/ThiS family protein n=1 Tax=Flavobacterium cellulosilyticum TaxID=2541731 RepID=A0A4R5CGY5_9FLAO|nr:MoaD/ThiS family protein [Flavobacterium cellulosilyticum]TDD98306.1 MoaD/ThiS family protein [Flavobacterium cellulosilyticum]
MTITLKYFGLLVDVCQKKEEQFYIEDNKVSISFLRTKMETTYEELKNANYSIAVNQSMSSLDYIIKDQDVIALLPPFAGG